MPAHTDGNFISGKPIVLYLPSSNVHTWICFADDWIPLSVGGWDWTSIVASSFQAPYHHRSRIDVIFAPASIGCEEQWSFLHLPEFSFFPRKGPPSCEINFFDVSPCFPRPGREYCGCSESTGMIGDSSHLRFCFNITHYKCFSLFAVLPFSPTHAWESA